MKLGGWYLNINEKKIELLLMMVGNHGNTVPCIPAKKNIFFIDLQERCWKSNLINDDNKFSHSMFCKNDVCLAVAREHHRVVTREHAP